ncbi:hypothetical protein Poli38472_004891 [Pythium oligandrum]|uniref:Uncharacterized protein n=1 Tax=Pythium oligandrum TaxID=41045 RepID=A0A8K1FHJ6_PYTOL|nr:hypothetical protein Poli38472_004891 [Pythium oligandrum]|eukprot:TMW59822.1 hypothetical protein Poli38472_004891 [Pythium oligandrum]
MYNQVDAVLSAHVSPHKQSRDTRLVFDSNVGLTMQIVESRVLPFSFKATADALWTVSVCHEYQTVCRETKKVDIHTATSDMMSKSFEGMLVVPQKSAEVHVKIALQRFNEPNRVILVHHILNDPKNIAGKPVCGAMMRHQSWTVLEQGPHDSTLMRVYHTATPDVYGPTSEVQSTLYTLTNFVLLVVQAHLDLDLRQLEDLLLCSDNALNI